MKKCVHCLKTKPLEDFYKNGRAIDGRWHWCIDCEKLAREQSCEKKYVLSFSGGKDSTALLALILEKKLPLDKIIYFDCEDFEFPEMADHIEKVKNMFGVEIDVCKPLKPFRTYIREIGWATPALRWCTNEKINSIRRALRFLRPSMQYIGYAADETRRVNRATKKNTAKTRDKFLEYSWPLVDAGVTEADALGICRTYGFDWGGLYDVWDRVSCWCCPLQGLDDLAKLKLHRPGLYAKLLEMDKTAPEGYKFGSFRCWGKKS